DDSRQSRGVACLVTFRVASFQLVLSLVGLGLAGACAGGHGDRPACQRRLVVLGLDGLDPGLVRRFMAENRMPNLAALAERGALIDLESTMPPQSPVAWATFITGLSPDGHGIFDFVHRDPATMEPYLSTSLAKDPERAISLAGWRIPLGSARIESLRGGRPFWELLEEHGIPATIVRLPDLFPPDEDWRSETLTGMGTPDLLGTYGTFQRFASDPAVAAGDMSGGIVHRLELGDGSRKARAALVGPRNPLRTSGAAITIPLEVTNMAIPRLRS
ncbi:MAG: alkaline phosphatase family protein, partial [Pseudomonadota bacterium]